MSFRSILLGWLQNAARAKIRQTMADAAGRPTVQPMPAAAPEACHWGAVFALEIESGCLEDRLQGLITIRGGGFTIREGGLRGRRVTLILAGPGRRNAARAVGMLIDGHRPRCVVSAGFAGGLSPRLQRNDILVADRLLDAGGREIALPPPAGFWAPSGLPDVHRGPLLSIDRVVRSPNERQALWRRFGALAVDMETFAAAEACRLRNVPFAAVRVINDTADETLPPDVERLLNQKSNAARWGAALGAACRRPASVKDMYRLRENALIASGRLAEFLAGVDFQ